MQNNHIEYEPDCIICGGINCIYCKKEKVEATTNDDKKADEEKE